MTPKSLPLRKGRSALPTGGSGKAPGGYGIRPYAVGVDARIDPEGSGTAHALQTNNTRYNICMI